MKYAKQILSLCLAAVLFVLLQCPLRAFADTTAIPPIDSSKDTQLTLQYKYEDDPLSDVTFHLYLVGTVNHTGTFTIDAPFNEEGVYGADDTWDVVAEKMAKKAEDDGVAPVRSAKTDADGLVTFKSEDGNRLAPGLYLVVGESITYEDDECVTAPFLISLPTYENDQWNYSDVKAAPKASIVTNYTVFYHESEDVLGGAAVRNMPAAENFFITDARILELFGPIIYGAEKPSGGLPRSGDNGRKNSYYRLSDTVPQADGYTFLGWTDTPHPLATDNDIGYQTVAFFPETAQYNVYALWQKKADGDTPGSDNPGSDNPGSDNPGSDNPGSDNPGSDNPGSDNPDTPGASGNGGASGDNGTDTGKKDPILPQTGVLWWPVAALGALGLAVLVCCGTGKKKTADRRGVAQSSVLPVIGVLLITSSVCLVVYNTWDSWRAGDAASEESLRVIQYLPTPGEESESAVRLTKRAGDNLTEMPTQSIDGTDFAAMLSIPSLSLELPVRNEWSYPGLRRSPCRYTGSAYTDNLVICGHNYTQHFGRLKQLAKGDEVLLVAMNGDVFRYQVEEVTALSPSEYQKMTDSAYDLTLFTCTLGGQQRVTVRCSLVHVQSHSPYLIRSEYVFF